MKIKRPVIEDSSDYSDAFVCQDCGSAENVCLQEDPYCAAIEGDHSLYLMCDKCAKAHAEDI